MLIGVNIINYWMQKTGITNCWRFKKNCYSLFEFM